MRIVIAAGAALTLLFTLVFAGSAAAQATCTHPASAYSAGGPAGAPPGPQPVNDPIFVEQWGLEQIKAPAAWSRGDRGAGAVVAVVDSGVDLAHPDLQAHLVPGADLTPSGAQGCPGPQDENGHGTHVAGIAAAVTDNGIGVAGTAPDGRVMPVRVLDAEGGAENFDPVIAGIRHAADNGADVINLSLGGDPPFAETPQLNEDLSAAVDYAYSKGAVVVGAAGNESVPLCSYPAAAEKAICVAATDRRGAPTFYSNFPNSAEDNVRVRAPGGSGGSAIQCESSEDVWSTIWPADEFDCKDGPFLSGYEPMSGTSMSAPFVSGLAAILSAKGLSNAQIYECIRTTSSNRGAYDPVYGYGIVDADAATRECSPSATPAFAPSGGPGGGGGGPIGGGGPSGGPGGDFLVVKLRRAGHRRVARRRKVRVVIRSSKPMTVKLRAVVRKAGRRARRAGRRKVTMAAAGKRRVSLRIRRLAARRYGRNRGAVLKVRYRGGGFRGVATRRRR